VQGAGKRLRKAWQILAARPWFTTLANVLGVFAGLLGTLYTDDIRAAFPFEWAPGGTLSVHALVFWSCFLIFAFTFVSRESAVEKGRIESERRLDQTIRTMPPRGFVAEFARYYEQCFKAVRALEKAPEAKRNQVVEVIRLILWSIASLARKYDAALDATYGANLMFYFESPRKWAEYSGGDISGLKMLFVEPEIAFERMPVLVLANDLAAADFDGATAGNTDGFVERLDTVALPVISDGSARSTDGKRWRLLPGAPLAFFEQKPNAYNDTSEIGKWCRERGDFSESICQQVERYFSSPVARQAMRSFASLPVTSRLDNVRLGVLNLHSSRANLLFGEGAPSQFFPLTQPFIAMLADLVAQLLKLKV